MIWKKVIALLLWIAVSFVAIGFIIGEPNPANWNTFQRFLCVISVFFVGSALFWNEIKKIL